MKTLIVKNEEPHSKRLLNISVHTLRMHERKGMFIDYINEIKIEIAIFLI